MERGPAGLDRAAQAPCGVTCRRCGAFTGPESPKQTLHQPTVEHWAFSGFNISPVAAAGESNVLQSSQELHQSLVLLPWSAILLLFHSAVGQCPGLHLQVHFRTNARNAADESPLCGESCAGRPTLTPGTALASLPGAWNAPPEYGCQTASAACSLSASLWLPGVNSFAFGGGKDRSQTVLAGRARREQ